MGVPWSFVYPGYPRSPFVSPSLFQLSTRHWVFLYVRQMDARERTHLSQLWFHTLHLKWGPFFRLRSATKHLGFMFEDLLVLIIQNAAYSVDDDLCFLKHTIRDSYQQFYLAKASQRRQDCSGQKQPIDVINTRAFYLFLQNPIHQFIMRHILTGSLDHTYRLYKFNLVASPGCPHCNACEETAEHIFWYCSRWDSIRHEYSTLLRLFSLVGTQWPKYFLHCGWIELFYDYGISLLSDLGITYNVQNLVHDTHRMFLKIILALAHRFSGASVYSFNTTQSPYHSFLTSHYSLLALLMCTAARRRLTVITCVQFRLKQPIKPVIWEPKKNIYTYTYVCVFA